MKILNKAFLLMLIMTVIGCSTDDLEIYSAESNNVEVKNTIANKVIEETGVGECTHDMIFNDSYSTYEERMPIISYYLITYPNIKRILPSSLELSLRFEFTIEDNEAGVMNILMLDKRFSIETTCTGPKGDDDDDDDENDNIWG